VERFVAALLVVTDARIHQDSHTPDLHDECLEIQEDVAVLVGEVRDQPLPAGQDVRPVGLDEPRRIRSNGRHLEHAGDLRGADRPAAKGFHFRCLRRHDSS
jgi:hypothetical protein